MFNVNTIKEELLPLVGFHQNDDPAGAQLLGHTAPSSGMYVDDEDPLLSIENLAQIAPDFERTTSTEAERNQAFTDWIKRKLEGAIVRTVNDWTARLAIDQSGKNLIERNELFTVAGKIGNNDPAGDKIVGFEFRPASSRSVVYTLNEIGIQLTADQLITVYLFHSRKTEPVLSEVFNYNQANSLQWFKPTIPFQMTGEGNWYLGYLQSDLVGRSINGIYDYGYSTGGVLAYPTGSHFICTGVKTPATTAELWDISRNAYTNGTNFGLNVRLTAHCDYTNLIVEQKHLFAASINYAAAIAFLKEIHRKANPRTNRYETNIDKDDVLFEMVGNTQGRDTSLTGRYKRAIEAIGFDDRMIDPVCNCRKRTGVNYTTMP